jgi:hypothetical protein
MLTTWIVAEAPGGPVLNEYEYHASTEWIPLPAWATYFWTLGEKIGETATKIPRVITVVSVPTRDFVAAFAATGFLSAWSISAQLTDPNVLPVGQHVFVPFSGELRLAVVSGREPVLDPLTGRSVEAVVVDFKDKYKTKVKLCPGRTHRLIRTTQTFSAGTKQRARPPEPTQLCDSAVHGDPAVYEESESLDCVILGNPRVLEPELTAQEFRPLRQRSGTLSGIVRAKEFSPGEPWHTRIISSRVRSLPEFPGAPALVIFDGARTFKKWRLHFGSSNSLVILDRSDPEYASTVQVVEEEYGHRVRAQVLGPPPPLAIEVTSFEARA